MSSRLSRPPSQQRNDRQTSRQTDVHQCKLCLKYHPLKYCCKFLNMEVARRRLMVKKYNYCGNCLARSHTIRSCTSFNTCKRCDSLHHTLLHLSPQRSGNPRREATNRGHRHRKPAVQRTSKPTPNAKILSEAIKSLAQVLCA